MATSVARVTTADGMKKYSRCHLRRLSTQCCVRFPINTEEVILTDWIGVFELWRVSFHLQGPANITECPAQNVSIATRSDMEVDKDSKTGLFLFHHK